jgi:hypothetical protein
MLRVLFNLEIEASAMVSKAISFGRTAWRNNTNPRPIGGRPDEFNAGGLENGLDLQERPRSALGNAIHGL